MSAGRGDGAHREPLVEVGNALGARQVRGDPGWRLKLGLCDKLEVWDMVGGGREVQEGGKISIPTHTATD